MHQKRPIKAPRSHIVGHEGRSRESAQHHAHPSEHLGEQNAKKGEKDEAEALGDLILLLVRQLGIRVVDETKAVDQVFPEQEIAVHDNAACEDDYVDEQRKNGEAMHEDLLITAAQFTPPVLLRYLEFLFRLRV